MTKVTAENIDEIKDRMKRDQAAELEIGCETGRFTYSGGCSGTITIWPRQGRAAIEFGGDSIWGDWDATRRIVITEDCDDDGTVLAYDESGDLVNPNDAAEVEAMR